MSAKLLNNLTDENPDLHKQIGCMTGIFQMFDRHNLLTGRRHHRKRLPSGDDALSDSHLQIETHSVTSQIVLEKNLSKSLKENQRVSVESSTTSFSSSSCSSSFSSLEYNKSTQQEPSFDRTAIPERPLKNTTVQITDIDSRPPPSSPHLYPKNLSPPSCRQPLDFRDIVKDSIHRDNHSLSIKTSNKRENKGEVKRHVLKHKDSPRPLPLPETTCGSCLSSKNEGAKMSEDLNRSVRVLAKLKEAPRYLSENRPVKLSNEAKDGSFFPVASEASRFSYDGREISRSSVDSREQSKCSTRLRELPRLSLDSRKSSMSSNFDSKTNTLVKDLDSVKANQKTYRSLTLEQDLESHRQPTSVVARLMGLEAMPSNSGMQGKSDMSEESITDSTAFRNLEAITPSSKSMKMTGGRKEERCSCSPKSSNKGLAVPQSRSVEPTAKPVPNSRIPFETAPWKQGRSKGKTQQMAVGCREGRVRQQHESVYSEIGRKLKELEFQQSNKDVRALKQILDAIQVKRQLESDRDESPSSEVSYKKSNSNRSVIGIPQNLKTASRQDPHSSRQDMPRPLEASIVIMKPAKSVNKSSNVSAISLIPFDGLSSLSKVQTVDDGDVKRIPANNCLDKEETLRADFMEPAIQIPLSPSKDSGRHREKGSSQKTHVQQMGQVSPRLQQPTRENSGSITKASGSVSPRQQQRKIELEKKSRPPVPYESTKSKKQFSTRHVSESVSPRSRAQSKSEQAQKNSDKFCRNHSDTRNLRNHSDEVSLRTDSTASLASQMDMEVTSIDQSVDLISDSGSSSNIAVSNISPIKKEKKSLKDFNEDASAELSIASLDQPSPVSVLDASFYRDDMPHSPINRISNSFRGDGAQNPDAPTGVIWKTAGPESHLPNNPNCCDLNSTSYHKKLESIENLLQKLRKLSLSIDGESTNCMTSLSQMPSPDTHYVSQVLFASGLLNAKPRIQLHKSGHAVDPNMFFVLEQTKLAEPQSLHEATAQPRCESAMLHRRLIFDAVNEILTEKLKATGAGLRHRDRRVKLADNNIPTGERLLKEVCLEIERLRAHAQSGINLDEEEDDLKPMICEDVARQTEGWKDSGREVAGVVLDIERSLFRDLISEVLNGEAAAFVLDFGRRNQLL